MANRYALASDDCVVASKLFDTDARNADFLRTARLLLTVSLVDIDGK